MKNTIPLLKNKGIRPTTHRLAVGQFVLNTKTHPSAENVMKAVRRRYPAVSRATIYNVLDLFVKKGLLQRKLLREGMVVFDPLVEPHHHFIDEGTGAVFDVPLGACKMKPTAFLKKFDIRDYHIVIRGKLKNAKSLPLSKS